MSYTDRTPNADFRKEFSRNLQKGLTIRVAGTFRKVLELKKRGGEGIIQLGSRRGSVISFHRGKDPRRN